MRGRLDKTLREIEKLQKESAEKEEKISNLLVELIEYLRLHKGYTYSDYYIEEEVKKWCLDKYNMAYCEGFINIIKILYRQIYK